MVLAVQNLRVQYGARVLFNDLSFTVEDGERIAWRAITARENPR